MLRLVALYLVPIASIVIFGYYSLRAGSTNPAGWGDRHGVHVDIVRNYRLINSITLIAWIVVLVALVTNRTPLAQDVSIFASGYVLCDVVFYLPMARIAKERFPWDQFAIVTVEVVYAAFLLAFATASS